jgi:ankyrin repeat protein
MSGKTAMTHAAAHGFAEIVGRLLKAGVDARQRYGNALTALMWAASYEDDVGVSAADACVDLLLKGGAEIDAADDRGRTALMMAAELGHAEMVDGLIKRGADRDMRDRVGKTALDLAANASVRRALAQAR